jgi:hypothetical protein
VTASASIIVASGRLMDQSGCCTRSASSSRRTLGSARGADGVIAREAGGGSAGCSATQRLLHIGPVATHVVSLCERPRLRE